MEDGKKVIKLRLLSAVDSNIKNYAKLILTFSVKHFLLLPVIHTHIIPYCGFPWNGLIHLHTIFREIVTLQLKSTSIK